MTQRPRVGRPAPVDDATDGRLREVSVETRPRGQPTARELGGGVPSRTGEGPQGQPPRARARHGPAAVQAKRRAAVALGVAGRPAVTVDQAVEGLAAGVGDHEPGRHAGGAQRADHRAGRCSDDVVCASPIPARLGGQRGQAAPVSQAPPMTPPCSQHQSDSHAGILSQRRVCGRPERRPSPGSDTCRDAGCRVSPVRRERGPREGPPTTASGATWRPRRGSTRAR